ncbi:MAG: ABC transporter ATP-binding protein [Thermodesulfobacteriota bacterium]|nr:ABC transporter ATP-binding protein [Thermodesulfobacteriota bacterium]
MLKLVNVTKSFNKTNGDRFLAISNMNLDINENEFVCIVGPSGCGKTTTLRLISGLEVPTDGKIVLEGNEINGPDPERGVVFQEYTLFPWRSVIENVMFGLEVKKVGKKERTQTAKKYLEMVGLAEYADAYPYELSGGMQQRVAIIRALAVNPKILLMDEPFGALDARNRASLQNELIRIWGNDQKTVLFVTHSINEAISLADRVVIMKSRPGRIHDIIKVDLARPRDKMGKVFKDYYIRIRDMLENDLEKGGP